MRVEKLTSPRYRQKLARDLERTIRAAQSPPRPLCAAVPVQRREVLSARSEIERLVGDLLGPGDVQARGVSLARRLLADGNSPLYRPGPQGELDQAVRHARAALMGVRTPRSVDRRVASGAMTGTETSTRVWSR